MELILVGIDISANPGLLERLSALVNPVPDTLRDLRGITDEALVLSTCNRVEIYAVTDDVMDGLAVLDDYFMDQGEVEIRDPGAGVYRMHGREAAAHLFMVAAGLRSMVPGDAQITGQIRVALKQAIQAGTAGQILRLAFEHALKASRNVRARSHGTGHADSVAAAAIELISSGPIPMFDLKVVVVGAGKTGALVARMLAERGVGRITLANRSVDRARDVARRINATAIGLPDLGAALRHADVVISSTGAPTHIISAADLKAALPVQREHPLVVVDMAVPNDVEPSAGELPGVDLYDIYRIGDSLRQRSAEGAFACEGDAYSAIQEQVIRFEAGSRAARRGALIQSVITESEFVRDTELERAIRALQRQGLDPQRLLPVLNAMASSITKKLLHAPITYIRRTESDDSAVEVLRLLGHEWPKRTSDRSERPGTTVRSSPDESGLAA